MRRVKQLQFLVHVNVLLLLFLFPAVTHAANINQLIKSEPFISSTLMKQESDLIVFTHLDQQVRKWATGQRLPSGARFINAEQVLQIHEVLQGHAPSPSLLLTTGIDPLPDPHDPLNEQYTGPLADGDYVLFLKQYHDSQRYVLNGGFCAVYPVVSGKIIALDEGFKQFSGMTVSEFNHWLSLQ
ncbi:hypothetical protein NIE88_08260 [Sporolactobacillus shoreicorticis]|uniref:Uncharacterized protein n=1 Tax=Sporolactobacillus shoreicorticis TaxID=1923877 RepID=A0ABW5S646_9BACL|nr:hypothetical protein [Sporolactobacillus shoreicorticis]MCO7125762.1 hypothetical protein [Sporolactobacillus shoreicorticis]